MNISLTTNFASPERAENREVSQDVDKFNSLGLISYILDSLPEFFLILNKHRQIVFINQTLFKFLGVASKDGIYGKRPGEMLNCIHASERPEGCGTTEFCQECGAVKAILNAQQGKNDIQECRVIQKNTCTALDLKVFTTLFRIFDEDFVIFAITDIGDEKRKRVLERIFFHDIMNTAGGIKGITEVLKECEPKEVTGLLELLDQVSDRLVDEIKMQRELVAAENSELVLIYDSFTSHELLKLVKLTYLRQPIGHTKQIIIDKNSEEISLFSDRIVLGRVIGNLVKNALEATASHGVITLKSVAKENKVLFSVHNNSYILRPIQLQIFQRSFSTKGAGRGIGTYSIKLLTERYLKGAVSFISNSEGGTTFFIELPIKAVIEEESC